jgi:hypothetical protein
MKGTCTICADSPVEVRQVELFVIGSEGLKVCHACEMQVVAFIRALMNVAGRARKLGYLMGKRISLQQSDS